MRDRGILELGNQYSLIVGVNDLATKYPEIAAEWDYEKNGNLTPRDVSYGSGKKVWWKCRYGHSYNAPVNRRTALQRICPLCARSTQTSFSEQAIYFYLHKLYRDAISRYRIQLNGRWSELDIYIPSIKFAVEYDGFAFHNNASSRNREHRKYIWCQNNNIFLVRVKECIDTRCVDNISDTANVIYWQRKNNTDDLVQIIMAIYDSIDVSTNMWTRKSLSTRCLDIDIERDRQSIYAQYVGPLSYNLSNEVFQIEQYWDHMKNNGVAPQMINPHSGYYAWIICPICGISHQKRIADINRCRRGVNMYCKRCGNSVKNSKISRKLKRQIRRIDTDGNIVVFDGIVDALREIGKNQNSTSNISYACNHNTMAYGYHWEYVDNDSWVDNENTK